MQKYMFLIVMFCMLSGFQLVGDEPFQDRQQVVSNGRNQILKTQIATGDIDKKIEAVDWIKKMVAENSVDNSDREFMNIMHSLATESFLNPRKKGIGRTLVNDHPLIRSEVTKLLGTIGGSYSLETLCTVLEYEENMDVLLSAMYAISKIGDNPQKHVSDSIYSVIYRLRSKNRISNEFAYATLLALEHMYDNGQDVSGQKVYWVLVTLNDDSFYDVVRNTYSRVMEKIWES